MAISRAAVNCFSNFKNDFSKEANMEKIDFHDVRNSYRARTSNSHKYKYLSLVSSMVEKLFSFCFPSSSSALSLPA